MTRYDWARLEHFKPTDFGIPELMDKDFLTRLEAYRAELGIPIHINYSNGSEKHEPNSLHYIGKACDIMFDRAVRINDFICATRFFSEVGIYPNWQRAAAVTGGLHVGFNWSADRTVKQRRYWIGIKNKTTGANDYIPLTTEALQTHHIS